jgi:hypothetical protein
MVLKPRKPMVLCLEIRWCSVFEKPHVSKRYHIRQANDVVSRKQERKANDVVSRKQERKANDVVSGKLEESSPGKPEVLSPGKRVIRKLGVCQ